MNKFFIKVQFLVLLVFVLLALVERNVDCGRVRHQSPASPKQGMKFFKGIGVHSASHKQTSAIGGLWPSVFNLATKAVISVNATCGEGGREEFCRMHDGPSKSQHHFNDGLIGAVVSAGGAGGAGGNIARCGVCDNFSRDPHKRHPINYAIDDGTNRWWQSPPIYYGPQYEYVTITLDLKQVYQVAYVTIKAANSARPGAWILERSIDGVAFDAWQYFATSDKDCVDRYGIPARKGKPHYFTDTEVICTSFHSKLVPMENGEIHTFLIHGRPGANETSPELLQFTKARYVRFRFQGLRGKVEPLPSWLSQDINRDKKLFYSIRDVRIGGQCVCNGHASNCRHNVASGNLECECGHHTCGPNCDRCCPMFNQRQWGLATSRDARICLPCNCHGHAKMCHYDEDVDRSGSSLDANAYYQGGGVCDNCTKHTTGINCEQCVPGYYRPLGTNPDSEVPCVKCDCDAFGSTGECALEGNLLTCQCRNGYAGLRCDTCDLGHRGYPNCEQCPCNQRGSMLEGGRHCEGECSCKSNVEGKYCDRCKMGYFSLQATNPEGCSSCYCSGVTSVCSSAYLQPQIFAFNHQDSWLVSDISVKEMETPIMDDRGMLTVGNNEIIGIEAYYWLAPTQYTGNKLSLYGSNILYKVHWVVMRGDTSGKPTTGPNLILVGQNGMRIACGDDYYTNSNMTFLLPLDEYHESWYHVPDDVDDIITRLRRTEYKGDRVTHAQFMSVLNNIKHILLRAKFHTDQIEVSLEEVVVYSGNFTDGYSPVEECSCPSGYTGLSCELCQYGHVRVYGNTSTHETQGYCVKCNCNAHSESCNAETGECECEHNTIGEQCERCAAGYYGNPLLGSPTDCKKCACPLVDEDNNFSPSCQLDSASISNDDVEPGYVCTQCPRGYTGDHCEICDDGHFGVPSVKGGRCVVCTCGGGPCDRITGQCLSCRGNTEGWKCDRCKEGFFGNAAEGCTPCHCDPLGSTSGNCNNETGDCECKEHFIERTCNKCESGYGNVTAMCVECNCDLVGAKTNECDPTTGMCDCQPGVEGFKCDACQHLYYGFSATGCTSCNCSLKGSELSTCHIVTGQCRCKPNYVGLTCDRCRDGYYDCPQGCNKCNCDEKGSESHNCRAETGHCKCKPGVDGKTCNTCKSGYYGFSKNGCKECEVCNKKGHICDQETGRCACPPNSHGELCTQCKPNHWGFEPNVGCRSCNCSETGSIRSQCDLRTSTCTCQQGYTGIKCDECAHGYYGYPKCRRCSCHYPGTDIPAGRCDATGVCQCDDNGNCPCKSNVMGRRCNKCKESSFGLHLDNWEGCTECFCFGRSKQCMEAGYTWSKIRMKSRTLTVGFIDNNNYERSIQTALYLDTNNFEVIEGTEGNVTKSHDHFNNPLYWRLPERYAGDRILSYGGYLRFSTTTTHPPQNYHGDFTDYPIARIEGNGIKLIHYPNQVSLNDKYEVRLHESNWRRETIRGTTELMLPVSRDMLMVTLQSVSDIFIKASDYRLFENLTLGEVTLDAGIKVYGNPPPLAMGVELCECPREFNGTSCQNPSMGNFREKHIHHVYNESNDIDAVIGRSTPCSCNGRSNICDTETGHCFDCSENTSGTICEKCAEGFYGDPIKTKCHSCACPSEQQNFAISCAPNSRGNHFICKCKQGYYGPTCDRCSPGYYGQPHLPGGTCQACNCNSDGSSNMECDKITGACVCKPGIVGEKCNECSQLRHILENNKCLLCDDCIQILLDDLDALRVNLANETRHLESGTLQPPWETLTGLETRCLNLSAKVDAYLNDKEKLNEVIVDKDIEALENEIYTLKDGFIELSDNARAVQNTSRNNRYASEKLLQNIEQTRYDLLGIKKTLSDFGTAHISTKEALKRGQKLYVEIKKEKARINSLPKIGKIRRHCEAGYKKAELLANSSSVDDLNEFQFQHNDLLRRTKDLEHLLKDIRQRNEIGKSKNFQNAETLAKLQIKYKNLHTLATDSSEMLTEQKKLIEDAKIKLNTTSIADYDEMNDLIDELDDRISDEYFDKLIEDRKKLDDHNKMLTEKAREYEEEFAKFEKELKTLKASGRLTENPSDMITDAKIAYESAKDTFDELVDRYLEPEDGGDTLHENSSIAEADSERLQARIAKIKDLANEIREKKETLERRINTLKQHNWDNGLANNNQTEKLNHLKLNKEAKMKKMKEIEDTIRKAVHSLERSREVHKAATDLNITKKYNLDKNWEKFLNLSSAENIKKFNDNMQFTNVLLQNVSNYNGQPTGVDVLNQTRFVIEQFKAKKARIEEKLATLRNNILKGNQIASTIFIPLRGSDCGRRYKLTSLEPSSKFELSIAFTYNTSETHKQTLFFIHNDKELIRLEAQRKRLHFTWKFDKEREESWNFENIASVAVHNFVLKMDHTQKKMQLNLKDFETRVIKTDLTKSFFGLGQETLQIGMNNGQDDTVTGIPGCIKDLFINNKQIGLWDFTETFGSCESCSSSKHPAATSAFIEFNGDGYIAFKTLPGRPEHVHMLFKIRTFDRNAIILFIYAQGSYVAITLRNGFIRFEMMYKNNPSLNVIYDSILKCNNGREVVIAFTKEYVSGADNIIFKVNDNEEKKWKRVVNRSNLIKILQGEFYFGGFPPDFDHKKLPNQDFSRQSYMGIFSGSVRDSKPLYLETAKYQVYGVKYFKPEAILSYDRILLDKPSSFVTLKLQETNQLKGPISFILRTQSRNGEILQITPGNLAFTLVDGKIQVLQNGKLKLESISTINNNDEYTLIELDANLCNLFVDGIAANDKNDCKAEKVPQTVGLDIQIGGRESIQGVIKEIRINSIDVKVTANSYVGHENAQIGRTKPIERRQEKSIKKFKAIDEKINDISMKDMSPALCEKVTYAFEPNAFKFGDSHASFISYLLQANFWKTNYTMEFEFRTFNNAGLLFLAHGNNHYNILLIKNGSLELIVKGKKIKQIQTKLRIDDGRWHRVVLDMQIQNTRQKKKRLLRINIDGDVQKSKIPQNKINSLLYIGNIPDHISNNYIMDPFRGCIRSLKINNTPSNLFDKKAKRTNIGQCFSNIQRGSYFRGDSYAIYDNAFTLNNYLDLAFDFRTDQQNGILLSVSHSSNRPALSIELQNGAVVMSVDMGNGFITNVTNNLARNSACNNEWHKVIASFTTELSVKVDDVTQTWVLNGLDDLKPIAAPLYIGGLPDAAPGGTLKIRENFKGCIRNLAIDNKSIDWTNNTTELVNVSVNSCPVNA